MAACILPNASVPTWATLAIRVCMRSISEIARSTSPRGQAAPEHGADCPCRIPDYEIEALKARADASGIIRLPPPPPLRSQRQFAKGEKVKIVAGQFAHFDAIHSGMRRGDLERVLITILGAQREVSVARHLVA